MLDRIGVLMHDLILGVAKTLAAPAVPGVVSIFIFAFMGILIIRIFVLTVSQRRAVKKVTKLVSKAKDQRAFAQQFSTTSLEIRGGKLSGDRKLSDAWEEFRETVIEPDDNGNGVIENATRPEEYFNISYLGFGLRGWRFWPGVFVSVGLFLTFLGLVAALVQTGETLKTAGADADQALMTKALSDLLAVASAKFIMSLSGLLASIILSLTLRWGSRRIERAVSELANLIERKIQFISIESLSRRHLEEARGMRNHLQRLNTELIEAISKPLEKAVNQGADAAGETLRAVAGQVADTLSSSISRAGEQMEVASDKMADLTMRLGSVTDGFVTGMEKTTTGLDAVARRLEIVTRELAAAGDGLEKGATPLAAAIAGTSETTRAIAQASIGMVDAAKTSLGEQSTALTKAARAIREQVEAFEQRAKVYDGEMERALRSYKDNLDSAIGEVEQLSESVHDRYADALQRLQSVIDGARSFAPESITTNTPDEA